MRKNAVKWGPCDACITEWLIEDGNRDLIECPVCKCEENKWAIAQYGGCCYECARKKWIAENGPLGEDEIYF